jgi:hypothetical protein
LFIIVYVCKYILLQYCIKNRWDCLQILQGFLPQNTIRNYTMSIKSRIQGSRIALPTLQHHIDSVKAMTKYLISLQHHRRIILLFEIKCEVLTFAHSGRLQMHKHCNNLQFLMSLYRRNPRSSVILIILSQFCSYIPL